MLVVQAHPRLPVPVLKVVPPYHYIANRLDLHLVCTYGMLVEAMLSYSPRPHLVIYCPAIPG